MNTIDSSLCSNCNNRKTCTLTESKRFIWSCSEFDNTNIKSELKTSAKKAVAYF